MILDRLTNLFIFLFTTGSILSCFRKNGKWDLKSGRKALRFFTILSNIFAGIAAFPMAVTIPRPLYNL